MEFTWSLLLLPFIAATIGWFTNFIAVKMLFHPRKPIKFLFFSFQGIFPKRQAQIAISVGKMVANDLLNAEDLQELLKLNFVNMTNFNLIPLNGHMDLHGERYYSSSDETCNAFRLTLMDAGFKCFTRKNMGEDIEAACGMLNSPEENSATKNSE